MSATLAAPTRPFYRPELDGLRFLAFLAVYVNHTFLFGARGHHRHLPDGLAHALGSVGIAGAFGVDLFFVLSAYLITELLLRERDVRGSLDVRAFYVRRILRIWPLYFAFLFFAFGLHFFVPGEDLSFRHLLAFSCFAGNWMYIAAPVGTVAAPLWSVSVEEQFYIVWPWAVRHGSTRRIAWLAGGLVGVGLLVRYFLVSRGLPEPWISKGSLSRADGIAGGILLAVALHGRPLPQLRVAARTVLAGLALGTLLGVAHGLNLFGTTASVAAAVLGWPLVAIACVALVVSVLGGGAWVRVLQHPVLVYLGRISFGLYVFHQVGLRVGEALFPGHASNAGQWLGWTTVGLGLTIPMAMASYRWLEQPFLRLKQRRYTVVASRPDLAPGAETPAGQNPAGLQGQTFVPPEAR